MFFEEGEVFFLKGFAAVVFGLVFDVGNGFVQLGHADAEGAVAFLPGEIVQGRKGFMQPEGGLAFDESNGFGD